MSLLKEAFRKFNSNLIVCRTRMYQLISTVVLIFVVLVPLSVFSAEITTGMNTPQKIVERGQTTSGCRESSSKIKKPVIGKWFALTDIVIRPTNLYVHHGKVVSNNPREKYYFKGIPFRIGKIVKARFTRRNINTTARTEYSIVLSNSRYRFIEWGASGYALITISPSGKKLRTEIYGTVNNIIPPEAYIVTKEPRDSYDPGGVRLVKAGDFNRDGIVDLLLRYWVKEASGLVLWLSDPKTKRHLEPFDSPTEYSDC